MKYLTFFIFSIVFLNSETKAQNYLVERYLKNNFQIFDVNTSIGIVDFRNILKQSSTMKKIGQIFLKLEKKINKKIKERELEIRNEESRLLNEKNILKKEIFDQRKKKLKEKITTLQKLAFEEQNKLKLAFQQVQKKLKDILAKIIKDISEKRNIDIVVLKENIFLYNNNALNITNEALKKFDLKTKNLKITTVIPN